MRESSYPMVPVEQALATVVEHVAPLPATVLPLERALGLVLAEDVEATISLPPFPASVVDGFALCWQDGHSSRRLIGEQTAGHVAALSVETGTAVRIMTGAPIPPGADAVIPVEDADEWDGEVTPHRDLVLKAGMGIRPVGQDVAAGTLVLAAGTVLGSSELGVLASLGRESIRVHRRPQVGVFSTGDELVEPGSSLGPGQIWDSNRPTLKAAVVRAGGRPLDLGVIPDTPAILAQRLLEGLTQADILVTSGGVSMGELDLLKPLLERWGTVHFGRVLMKPGKPLTFATVSRQSGSDNPECPFFALPGNPVSALVTFQLFVRPAIRRLLGYERIALPRLTVTLGHDFRLDPERPEFHRVTLQRQEGRFVAVSTGSQASSRLLSVVGANALLVLEQAAGVLPAGSEREALLLDDSGLQGQRPP
jgi:molybdenum cofactor synthesis domain-containing protein